MAKAPGAKFGRIRNEKTWNEESLVCGGIGFAKGRFLRLGVLSGQPSTLVIVQTEMRQA